MWDKDANGATLGYKELYYCVIDEEFFELSPIAPLRCPHCYADARYIIGPLPAKEVDLNALIRKHRKKYRW